MIFGVSLVDYTTSRGLPDGSIPKLVHICIEEVEKRGLNSEGIYRVCTTERSLCNLSHMTVLNYRFLVDMLSFKK